MSISDKTLSQFYISQSKAIALYRALEEACEIIDRHVKESDMGYVEKNTNYGISRWPLKHEYLTNFHVALANARGE